MDHEMDLPYWPTIFDFRDAWVGARPALGAIHRIIMIKHGIFLR